MKKPSPLVEITGTGRFLPDDVVTNDDLAERLDTSDEWIRTRTGIQERRIAPDDMGASYMGAAAARKADMKAVLILRTAQFPAPTSYDGNLLLDYLLDADVRVINNSKNGLKINKKGNNK